MERQTMDHGFAIKFQACEKYVLGELSPELRDAYEEHYFSCAECAAGVRAALEFAGGTRQVLAAEPVTVKSNLVRETSGWFAWFRPVIVVPAFALLLAILAYQNFVTIPQLQSNSGSQVLPMFSLITANTRGEETSAFTVRPDQPFGVYVDIPYDDAYGLYTVRLVSPAATVIPLRSLTLAEARKTQVITVNPGSQSGKYTLVISGLPNADAAPASARELARMQFVVAVRK